jgi:signal peptidase I
MTNSRRLRILSGFAALAVVGGLWLLFAPSQLGGSIDYVIIRGVSMEPRLHAGDLAILHRADTYQVGDVVGYQSGLLHQFVLHRIVAKKGDKLLFKGDHNNFVDSYVPTKHDVAGRLWFDLPRAGLPIRWLHVPLHAALLGGVIALLAGGGGAAEARRKRRRDGAGTAQERLARSPSGQLDGFGDDLWLVAAPALFVVMFALLGLAAFTHARTRTITDPAAYLQAGSYSYSASVPASSVYPKGVVRPNDPIYASLVQRLRIAVRYRFSSTHAHSVDGKISLRATVRNADGWRAPIAISPPRRFTGDSAAAAVTIGTKRIYDQMQAFARDTGITSGSFWLDVVPRVTLHGDVAGRPIVSPAALAPLTFTVSTESLALAQQPSTSGTVGASTSNPLAAELPGSMQLRVPATLELLRLRIGLDRAKEVGVAGATLALLVCLAAFSRARKRRRAGELTRILRRYGSWIVPVESPLVGPKVVDVSSMESLGRLAEHYERAILHEEHARGHTFALEEAGTLFRYHLGDASPQPLRQLQPPQPQAQVPVSTRSRGSYRR